MKHFSTLIKGLLIIVLFTTGSVALSTATGVKTVSSAKAATTSVGYNQVYQYLESKGYIIISLSADMNTKYNWIAHTTLDGRNYSTTVFCTSSDVIGNADVIM